MPTVFETQPQQQPDKNTSHAKVESTTPVISSPHDRMSLFTQYARNPVGVRFETQVEEEEVVLFMRQHFILNVPWIAATILLLLAPFGIIPLLLTLVPIFPSLPSQYTFVSLSFWYVAVFGYALVNFIRWYYNIYIVTTQRVVDIDFIQLLHKKFSEARLDKIEDLSYTASGFTATLFNFGDIHIQTAGENPNFAFESIPRPADVVQTIGTLIKQFKGTHT